MPDLLQLEQLLIFLAEKYAEVPQIGRTHGKHAEPITFGFALATYVSRLLGRIRRIIDSAENLRGKFSGSVGAYNALSLLSEDDPENFEIQLLHELNLKPSDGSISTQIVEPEYLADLTYTIVSCFSVFANLADDIRHLHRTEIAEVQQIYRVDDIGSSTMPHKVNPRNFEHVKSMWKAMMPRMITVFMDQISEHQRDLTNSASGRFPIEVFVAFDYSTRRLISAFEKIDVDVGRMRSNLESSKDKIIAEPLYILLAMNDVPNAYSRVRELVAESETSNKPLTEIIRRQPDVRAVLEKLTASQMAVLQDPAKYVGQSSKRAHAVAGQAQTAIEVLLSPYLGGRLMNDESLEQFRQNSRPSYELSLNGRQEFVTATDHNRQYSLGHKDRHQFS
jgi:adenylosuccinate lyase